MRLEFSISCGRDQYVLLTSPLQEVCITNCGRVWMGSIPETTYSTGGDNSWTWYHGYV